MPAHDDREGRVHGPDLAGEVCHYWHVSRISALERDHVRMEAVHVRSQVATWRPQVGELALHGVLNGCREVLGAKRFHSYRVVEAGGVAALRLDEQDTLDIRLEVAARDDIDHT